jgi:pyochelin synthetase
MSQPVGQLVYEYEGLGVHLWEESGELRFRAPRGVLTDGRRSALRSRREEILVHLGGAADRVELVSDVAGRYLPFPVTDVQSAYLLGRGPTFGYGGVACHGYGELSYPALDPARMTAAWRALIERHDMLRAVVDLDGSQRVLERVPPFEVPVNDVTGQPAGALTAAIEATRAEMDHRVFRTDRWPLFDARITLSEHGAVMHVSIDFLVADFVSIQIVLDELHHLYHRPDVPLAPLTITVRDYLLAERRLRTGHQHDRDRAYWLDRVDALPAAPELPLVPATDGPPRFQRLLTVLEPAVWADLRARAGRNGVSASTAVLAAYADVIAAWSRHPRFTLDVTLLSRLPLHPQVGSLVGDFTSVELLGVDADPTVGFADRARALQAQLWQDMDHRTFSGIEVMREITRRRGADAALFPVVFTSAIGLADTDVRAGADADAGADFGAGGDAGAGPTRAPSGELGYGISQTPQVWIDCQNAERDGELSSNWDVRQGIFPHGVVDTMFGAYATLLRRLAGDDAAWTAHRPVALSRRQTRRRAEVNGTAAAVPEGLLQDRVVAQALSDPDRVALVCVDRQVTYGELAGRAIAVADRLAAAGCRPGDLVGIVMDRGWEQVVGVLGALLAGAAYVPVDTVQPAARRATILASAGVRLVLTQWSHTADEWPEGTVTLPVDRMPPAAPRPVEARVRADALAYVIHTSGSTGAPKGVMISHRAALNTVVDINTRFRVVRGDRVLGLSNLGFDLSVYDIFGPLSVGGCLVIPAPDRPADPSHWADLIATHRVTLWNSVPAQMQMLHDYLTTAPAVALPTLRLALLSGDWIPVTLPDLVRQRLPALRLIGLGGATEASIWSIAHAIGVVPAHWRSIPYGRPLANQTVHVLDAALAPRPEWVAGELYIGGTGVALGYLGDDRRTAERFVPDPATGQRLYRTGDFGRYLPSGEIEFLGREDHQVKIKGYRIELAEIELALRSAPSVGGAVVVVDGDRPLDRRLVAFVEPAHRPATDPATHAGTGLATAARAAGDRAVDTVDRDRYLAFARTLDSVALPAMIRALRSGGLFGSREAAHTYPEILAAAEVAPRHRRLVRRWLRALTDEGLLAYDGDRYRLRRDVDPDEVDGAWAGTLALAQPDDAELLGYFRGSIDHLPALLRGADDPLALLFPEGRLDVSQSLYEGAAFNRWANAAAGAAVRRLAGQPRAPGPLRVLEVGAGGGGTTAAVLDALAGIEVDYLCTDLSAYFLNHAQARFGDRPGVRFAVYDLDEDFRAHGLAPNSYDVIVAGDVLHATGNVDRVLGRLRELLAPAGWIVALEMTRDHYQIMTSLELLVRLDGGGDFTDARQGGDLVFLGRESWLDTLRRAGADPAMAVPEPDGFITELGMCLLVARFKGDRTPVDAGGLTAHLRERLPEYMVPASLQIVDGLPLTGNGKIDRNKLRALLPRRAAEVSAAVRSAPSSELETRLAAIWAQALRVPAVGRDDDLFGLGGDSLVAAQIAGRILAEVPEAAELFFDQLLRHLLQEPTVSALAAHLRLAPAPAPVPQRSGDAVPGLLVPLAEGERDDPPWILVPDAAGSLDGYAHLVGELRRAGPVLGLSAEVAGGVAGGVAASAGVAVAGGVAAGVAARYARAIADAGHARVRLVATGPTAHLGVGIASSLAERGSLVESVVLVGGYRPAGGPEPAIYAGDLVVVRPATGPSAGETALGEWADICLGDLTVVDVDGDQQDLLRPPAVHAVAAAIGVPPARP